MTNRYYTLEEVQDVLGIDADRVRQLAADGTIREVRDAGKIMYRAEEVDRLHSKEGSSIVDLAVTDDALADPVNITDSDSFAAALSNLADGSSDLRLDDSSVEPEPVEEDAAPAPAAKKPAAAPAPAEIDLSSIPEKLPAATAADLAAELSSEIDLLPADADAPKKTVGAPGATGQVPDIGLSGSSLIGLEPSDETDAAAATPAAPKAAGGISVFDEEELEIDADPMGKTHISAAVEDFDAAGSGSGLLDLTREADDTSLGEFIDVISPTDGAETETETVAEDDAVIAEPVEDAAEDTGFDAAAVGAAAAAVPAVRRQAAAMTGAVPMNICALLGVLSLALVGLSAAAAVQGVWPSFLNTIARDLYHYITFGVLVAAAIGTGLWGILADRGK